MSDSTVDLVELPSTLHDERNSPRWVYAVGSLTARFASPGLEQEFNLANARTAERGSEEDRLRSLLLMTENRHLARDLCWILAIDGIDTYIVEPAFAEDYQLLAANARMTRSRSNADVIVGQIVGLASPDKCNGLILPVVRFTQVFSFDLDAFFMAIAGDGDEDALRNVELLYERFFQFADNAGATDEQRALNYAAVRYPAIYRKALELYSQGFQFTGVQAISHALSASARLVNVIFTFTERSTTFVERFYIRLDVTEKFPFIVSKLASYHDRVLS